MDDLKEYRKKELKDFVLVNLIIILYFSNMLNPILESIENQEEVFRILEVAQTVFLNAIVAAVVYIYVFIFDSLIAGDIKFKVAYLGNKGLLGETIFSDIRSKKIGDKRFTLESFLELYADFFDNLDGDTYKDVGDKRRYENAYWCYYQPELTGI